ncbi:MAG: phosphatidylserine decarboxylase [Candidatus Binatus sp.]|uniref:phosphatidylserine decarboxylase n=1 Tax=Candidatus Binatus sp. TaxID=2811406 RepID=UPI00271F597B|nr:phosphatidylserine decarboxylase [Candidatus Binatus sp.]MDO8433654.1 phosphatidylserine decarboxylase [Candidatus Binatus sp.]
MAGETDSGRPTAGGLIARAAKLIGIAAEGVIMSVAVTAAGIILIALGAKSIGAIVVLIAIAVAMFFRDPDRFPARTDGVVISGADGKVTDIAEVAFPAGAGDRCHRVSVFMSPLNVHVNRAPVGGVVTMVEHTSGEFRAAFRDDASEHNERNLIAMSDPLGRRFAMLQVAGYLARRIVCRLRARDRIQVAQRIGLIMFGSRVDHFFPAEYRVMVTMGQRVRAGETIIGAIEP